MPSMIGGNHCFWPETMLRWYLKMIHFLWRKVVHDRKEWKVRPIMIFIIGCLVSLTEVDCLRILEMGLIYRRHDVYRTQVMEYLGGHRPLGLSYNELNMIKIFISKLLKKSTWIDIIRWMLLDFLTKKLLKEKSFINSFNSVGGGVPPMKMVSASYNDWWYRMPLHLVSGCWPSMYLESASYNNRLYRMRLSLVGGKWPSTFLECVL